MATVEWSVEFDSRHGPMLKELAYICVPTPERITSRTPLLPMMGHIGVQHRSRSGNGRQHQLMAVSFGIHDLPTGKTHTTVSTSTQPL